MVKQFSMELAGRTLTVEIGKVAAQANGAALMRYGDTVVLSTATASEKPREGIDFLTLKVGEGGRTFGSVSSKEISEAAKKQLNLDIDKKKLQLENPIRNLGVTNVPVRLHPKVTGSLKVWVKEA